MDAEVKNDVAYKNRGKLLNTMVNAPFLCFLSLSKN